MSPCQQYLSHNSVAASYRLASRNATRASSQARGTPSTRHTHMAAVAVWTVGEVLQAGLLSGLVADLSPDGSRVAVRTYTDLYEWSVEGDDVAQVEDVLLDQRTNLAVSAGGGT